LIPDTTYPSLKVSYSWPNASQYAIERKVTSKLEGVCSALKGVKSTFSRSYAGYGEVFIKYDTAADIEKERFRVSTLIRQVHSGLPKGVSYPTLSYQRPDDNDIRLLSYAIIPKNDIDNHTPFIDKVLTPEITKNEGVSTVKFDGIPSYFYEIEYDVFLLNSLDITVNELEQQLRSAFTNKNLGTIVNTRASQPEEFLMTYQTIHSKEDVYNLPLKKTGTRIVRLKDIAIVTKRSDSPIHLFRINGQETISFSVIADKNANQITLANVIKKSIAQIEKNQADYDFILTNDATRYLKKELKSIFYRTLASFFFLLLFTIVIYRNMQYILNLFISLLVTLLITVIFFKVFEISIHIYSLMSIAISIGFVIDNAIITIDHYIKNCNKKIILPIFAATITTITPLLVIAFLDDEIQLNLVDFSWALIIVLISSLVVSFFFIPSIIQTKHRVEKKWKFRNVKRLFFFHHIYARVIFSLKRFRIRLSLVLLLLFGLPLFLLPEHMEGDSTLANLYNLSVGNEYYENEVRPTIDSYFGGALKLFVENSVDDNFIENPKRTSVSVRIKTPFGSTIPYINTVCKKFETSLQHNLSLGIDFFQTTIYDKRAAQIEVFFESGSESEFPYRLKGFLEKESLTMSGVDFTVFGVGKPFGTSSGEFYDSSILFTGYDYDKLKTYATLVSKKLEENNRIENVIIQSERSWFSNYKKKYIAKNVDFRTRKIVDNFYDNYAAREIGNYTIDNDKTPIKLMSNIKNQNSSYSTQNTQLYANNSLIYKPSYDLKFELTKVPDKIVKKNQEYQLALQYKFKGTYKHSELVKKEIIDNYKNSFTPGFTIKDGEERPFNSKDKKLYIPVLMCIFIIFSICAILLESFKKALLIISTIPITFIGLFFSLYYLEIGFSSGVYGGLILLVGLLVNTAIFIINEYINYNKNLSSKKSYIKAFNSKIAPITITIISTIVSLIPFLISNSSNNFWYPFAITICIGLFFSIVTVVCILPIYLIPNNKL
jgi:multidrug efflux pump subunit AcrB